MERPPKPQTVTFTLRLPTRDDSDAAYRRIRAAAKGLLRSYGLKCDKIEVNQGRGTDGVGVVIPD